MPPPNEFQMGRPTLLALMERQVGVRVEIPMCGINGYWEDDRRSFAATILRPSSSPPFVAVGLCDDGLEIDLTAATLMRSDVRADWRDLPPSDRVVAEAPFGRSKNERAYDRALEMAASVTSHTSHPRPGDVWLTLDGNGTNRRAFEAATRGLEAHPRVVTLEADAEVALAQRLLYGADVMYTAGHPLSRASRAASSGGGVKLGIEHALLRSDVAGTGIDLPSVRFLYLDYCGGPSAGKKGADLAAVFSRLPGLLAVAVTLSKRQHADLSDKFEAHVPTPWGFRLESTYHSNARVVSCLFLRAVDIPRRVSVPGWWWQNCPPRLKRKRFDGVVVGEGGGEGRLEVYFEKDRVAYPMHKRAVAHYSTDAGA
jgi:hypothetical protein